MRYMVKCWYGDAPGLKRRENPSRSFYLEAPNRTAAQRYAEGQCWDAIQKYEVFETEIEPEVSESLPITEGERLMIERESKVMQDMQRAERTAAYLQRWGQASYAKLIQAQEAQREAFYRRTREHWDTKHEWMMSRESRTDMIGPEREQ